MWECKEFIFIQLYRITTLHYSWPWQTVYLTPLYVYIWIVLQFCCWREIRTGVRRWPTSIIAILPDACFSCAWRSGGVSRVIDPTLFHMTPVTKPSSLCFFFFFVYCGWRRMKGRKRFTAAFTKLPVALLHHEKRGIWGEDKGMIVEFWASRCGQQDSSRRCCFTEDERKVVCFSSADGRWHV